MTKEEQKINIIKSRIKIFKKDLKDIVFSKENIVDKHIIFGTPYIFRDDENVYFELKNDVADFFKIYPSSVTMVGSCKLGFSIKPKQLWNGVREGSDIDLAIIDKGLFEKYWIQIFNFNINKKPRSMKEQDEYISFLGYFFRGWIRPDLFPFNNPMKEEIFEFTTSVYNKYDDKKVSIGIFKNEYFFKQYHINNINNIKI